MKIIIDENGISYDLGELLKSDKWYKLELYFNGSSYQDLKIQETPVTGV